MSEFKGTKSYQDLANENKEMLQMLKDLRNCKETWSDLFQSDKDRIELLIKKSKEI